MVKLKLWNINILNMRKHLSITTNYFMNSITWCEKSTTETGVISFPGRCYCILNYWSKNKLLLVSLLDSLSRAIHFGISSLLLCHFLTCDHSETQRVVLNCRTFWVFIERHVMFLRAWPHVSGLTLSPSLAACQHLSPCLFVPGLPS